MKKFVIIFLFMILSFGANAGSIEPPLTPTNDVLIAQIANIGKNTASSIETPKPEVQKFLAGDPSVKCMQENIFFEARNQGTNGMRAVADVTVNRSKDPNYPDTICGVVNQKWRGICQFSWVCDKRVSRTPRLKQPSEIRAWEIAGEIALKVLNGKLPSVVGKATHYHATYVNPGWSHRLQRLVKIGTHIFYKTR